MNLYNDALAMSRSVSSSPRGLDAHRGTNCWKLLRGLYMDSKDIWGFTDSSSFGPANYGLVKIS